jgi:L-alanine-DL-glutamate epimerase-like enolase superfamily enzyme
MAKAFGKACTPHMSGGGHGYLYMIHFVSALHNAFALHEFKGLNTNVQFECQTSPLSVVDGKMKVPTGPGLGMEIAPDFIEKHELRKG